jgi:hypothetical protein
MCNKEFVGFACVTASGEIRHQYRTTKFPSVFTGEATAVFKTLGTISESQGESCCTCSDSRSALMCLNSILILQIKKLVALKKHKKDINFVCIPAHTGIVLNEIADASAKDSFRKGEDAQYVIPVTDLKRYLKTKLRVAAEKWCRESDK